MLWRYRLNWSSIARAAPLLRGTLGTAKGALASRKSLQKRDRAAKAALVMTAEIHQLHGDRPASLDPMMALVAADMNAVNAVILARMQSEIPLIPELARHLTSGGGKRKLGRDAGREKGCKNV